MISRLQATPLNLVPVRNITMTMLAPAFHFLQIQIVPYFGTYYFQTKDNAFDIFRILWYVAAAGSEGKLKQYESSLSTCVLMLVKIKIALLLYLSLLFVVLDLFQYYLIYLRRLHSTIKCYPSLMYLLHTYQYYHVDFGVTELNAKIVLYFQLYQY